MIRCMRSIWLGTPGDHRELGIEILQIEPADDAVMPLFHKKHARARLERSLIEPELALSQPETVGVLRASCLGVGEEHLGRRLLDDRAADGTVEHVAGALGSEAHDTIQLPPGFRARPWRNSRKPGRPAVARTHPSSRPGAGRPEAGAPDGTGRASRARAVTSLPRNSVTSKPITGLPRQACARSDLRDCRTPRHNRPRSPHTNASAAQTTLRHPWYRETRSVATGAEPRMSSARVPRNAWSRSALSSDCQSRGCPAGHTNARSQDFRNSR